MRMHQDKVLEAVDEEGTHFSFLFEVVGCPHYLLHTDQDKNLHTKAIFLYDFQKLLGTLLLEVLDTDLKHFADCVRLD